MQRDSVVVRDTIREYFPVEIKTERIDTQLVVIRDTVRIADTLYMSLPLERRTYKREDFYAEVTGYNPRLTYIEVYPETVYVTEREIIPIKKNQFSIGIGAEYDRDFGLPVQAQYTRQMGRYFGAYGYLEYDLQSKGIGAGIGVQAAIGW